MGFPFNRPKASKARRLMTPTVRVKPRWASDSCRTIPAARTGEGSWRVFGFNRPCGSDWRCFASLISIRVAISVALIEIVVGAFAGNVIGLQITDWVNFLAGFGAILLTFLAGTEIDPRIVRKALLVEHDDRRRRLLRPLSRRARLCPFRHRLAVAAGADRRNFVVDDLGRGRLCGDDRDRLQPHRDRQDHSRRLLRQRSRHGAGARRRVRPLRSLAASVRRVDRRRARRPCPLCAVVVQEPRPSGERAGDEVRLADSAGARRAGRRSPAARRCCRPISSAWRSRRPFSPTASCRIACASSRSRS